VILSSKLSKIPDSQKQSRTGENAVPLRIYILTVWREVRQEAATWRFRLEDPQTCRQQGFVDAHDLMTILAEDFLGLNAGWNTNQEENSKRGNEQ
jgi:hypothetical protein